MYTRRKRKAEEEKRDFSSYVSRYINLCWTGLVGEIM